MILLSAFRSRRHSRSGAFRLNGLGVKRGERPAEVAPVLDVESRIDVIWRQILVRSGAVGHGQTNRPGEVRVDAGRGKISVRPCGAAVGLEHQVAVARDFRFDRIPLDVGDRLDGRLEIPAYGLMARIALFNVLSLYGFIFPLSFRG